MQVDKNSFPAHTHMLELSNSKVLIRPSQAESTKGKKNIIIGEERSEPLKHNQKESREFPLKDSTLWGQEEKRCARSVKTGLETGLTGPSGNSAKNPSNKSKARPSFKELLAKYEKEGAIQKQKGRSNKVKDTKPSSKHQEQSNSCPSQGNHVVMPNSFNGPIAPWYC